MKRTFRFAQYRCIATFLSSDTVRTGSGFSAGCAAGLPAEDLSSLKARYQAPTSSELRPAFLRQRAPSGTGTTTSFSATLPLLIGMDETTRLGRSCVGKSTLLYPHPERLLSFWILGCARFFSPHRHSLYRPVARLRASKVVCRWIKKPSRSPSDPKSQQSLRLQPCPVLHR